MMKEYKTLRYFIYLNVKAEYRGEGYRLAKKLYDCIKVNNMGTCTSCGFRKKHIGSTGECIECSGTHL